MSCSRRSSIQRTGWPSWRASQASTDFLLQQDALVAEAAADIGRDDADARLVQAETAGKTGADDVRQLSGGIDQQLFQPAIPGRDDAAALQRRHALPRGAKASVYGDGRRLREAFGADFDKGFEENVVVPVVVQFRLAGERGTHVNDGGQFLEVDLNSGGEVFGFGTRGGDTDCDWLADVAHLVGCQARVGRMA